MRLDRVVPFGRTLDEYIQIFNLSEADLNRRILGVGDGPASFNAEATQLGKSVCSIDPIYDFSAAQIQQRFDAVVDDILDQVAATPQDWVWSYHRSPADLRRNRETALARFLADYDLGKQAGRYRSGALPKLEFAKDAFDLALCSHFLFLYSAQVDYEFHRASIYEMLRVSPEIRIFPLLTLMLKRSPHLDPLLRDLTHQGYWVSVQRVPYELQRGGNEMLVVRR
ncbi:SAM-dependent methyltransferase [Lyngbya confervoides]|uniref:SAM-dependent methyltransferase n=1 Tax=Lyngbya confervoides BDU141951 TaxID=1574623 RepID=A0ABD4T3Q5_9CYAN|nr:SAM-dependent methyltransferase [Lyngbya confervoides]MCM1982945.1 SAM-dependent methyltransferase [Lyngbya confervoides BDU141951]